MTDGSVTRPKLPECVWLVPYALIAGVISTIVGAIVGGVAGWAVWLLLTVTFGWYVDEIVAVPNRLPGAWRHLMGRPCGR